MLGKKDGTVDGMVDETTLGSNDEFDVGYALGWSEVGSSVRACGMVGTSDGSPEELQSRRCCR